jgi:hypothetical protein
VRTWAPRGQTPVLQYCFNWKSLSAAAGITPRQLYFRLYPGAIRKEQVRDFLKSVGAALVRPAAADLGSLACPSQSSGAGLHPEPRRLDSSGVSAALRPRAEPGGIHLGLLETARVAQRLP